MEAQDLAVLLLALRIIAVILIVAVLAKQIKNIRTTKTRYPAVRLTVLLLTVVLLAGQAIPITLDTVVAFGETYPGRNRLPTALNSAYALNNATKDVAIGALLAFLYYRPKANNVD